MPQTADEFCNICWIDDLGSAPSIQLECGHVFHYQCVLDKLEQRWPSTIRACLPLSVCLFRVASCLCYYDCVVAVAGSILKPRGQECIAPVLTCEGARITFAFWGCPLCKKRMQHPGIEEHLVPLREMVADIEVRAVLCVNVMPLVTCFSPVGLLMPVLP